MSTTTENGCVADIPTMISAARVLFGPKTQVTTAFFLYMQPAGLKAAFREQALKCHPDLAAQLGVAPEQLQKKFTAVRLAYELLLPYVTGKKKFPFRMPKPDPLAGTKMTVHGQEKVTPRPTVNLRNHSPFAARTAASSARRETPDNTAVNAQTAARRTYYRGRMPERSLKFAEFLYFSKLITFEDMTAALAWQRKMRPRLRDIALEKGILKATDLVRITQSQLPGEPLWATGVRLGLLDQRKLRLLVGYQRLQGYPIGRYFLDNHILRSAQIEALLRLHRRHNILNTPYLTRAKVG